MRILLLLYAFFALSTACDLFVHLKSKANKQFEGLITGKNGKQSERYLYPRKGYSMTLEQEDRACELKPWRIQTFENGKEIANVVVSFERTSKRTHLYYEVGDDLIPYQKD